MQPTQVSRAAVWVKTQTASTPRQTRCKKYDWYEGVEKNERGTEKDQVNTEIILVKPTEDYKRTAKHAVRLWEEEDLNRWMGNM